MTYTQSKGLRDREYSKFVGIQNGSKTGVNIGDTIKTYEFTRAELTATSGLGSGLVSTYTETPLNGILKAVTVDTNDYEAIGSLFLDYSGANYCFPVWNLISGAQESNTRVSGAYFPRGTARTTENSLMSGTNVATMMAEIPLNGVYRLIGSGLGPATSCSGITLIYQ